MDWIFEESYKVFQKILDGTATSQQLIPLFTTIVMFGALLGRRHIVNFIQYCSKQAKIYSNAQSYEAKVLMTRAEVKRNIEEIKNNLIEVKGHNQEFTAQYNLTLVEIDQLSTKQPINHGNKEQIRSRLSGLHDSHQKSVKNFQEIEKILEMIAQIQRGEELRANATPISNSALEEARARQAQAESTMADAQNQEDLWPRS